LRAHAVLAALAIALLAAQASAAEADCNALLKALDTVLAAVLSGDPRALELAREAAGASVPGDIARAHANAYRVLEALAEAEAIAYSEGVDRDRALQALSTLEHLQSTAGPALNAYSNLLLGCAGPGGLQLKVEVDAKIDAVTTVLIPQLRDAILQQLGVVGGLRVDAPGEPVDALDMIVLRVDAPEGARAIVARGYLPAAPEPYATYMGQPGRPVRLPTPPAEEAYPGASSTLVPVMVVVEAYGSGGELLGQWTGTVQVRYHTPPLGVRVPAVSGVCEDLRVEVYYRGLVPLNATVLLDGEEAARLVLSGDAVVEVDTCNMTAGYHVVALETAPRGPYMPYEASAVTLLDPPVEVSIVVANPSIDALGRVVIAAARPPPEPVNLTIVVGDRHYQATLSPEEAAIAVHASILPVWAGTVEVYTPWSREPIYSGRVVTVSPPALVAFAAATLPALAAGDSRAWSVARQIAAGIAQLGSQARASIRETLRVYLEFLYRAGAPRIREWETLREHLARSRPLIPSEAAVAAEAALPLVEEDLYSPRRVPPGRVKRVLKGAG